MKFFLLKCFNPQLIIFAGETKRTFSVYMFDPLCLSKKTNKHGKPLIKPNICKTWIKKKKTPVPIHFESPMTNKVILRSFGKNWARKMTEYIVNTIVVLFVCLFVFLYCWMHLDSFCKLTPWNISDTILSYIFSEIFLNNKIYIFINQSWTMDAIVTHRTWLPSVSQEDTWGQPLLWH